MNRHFRNAMVALTTGVVSALAMADSFSNVTGSGKAGIGGIAKNVAGQGMQTMPLWEMCFYIGAVVAFLACIYTLWVYKQSRGQEAKASNAAVLFLCGVLAIAVPELAGNGIASLFGSGATQTVKPTTTPTFSDN